MADNFESRIDKLLSVDPTELTSDFVIKTIAPDIDLNKPYVDPQSKEGAEKIQSDLKKEVDNLFSSLQPKPLSISASRVDELACLCEGDSLYALILLEITKVKKPSIYEKAIREGVDKPRNINPEDIGIKTNIIERKNCPASKEVIEFLEANDPSFLLEINEEIFDNLDPLVLGKPSNSSVKKKRSLNILGFPLPLEVIMAGTTPVYFKLDSQKKTNQEAINKINEIIQKANQNSKGCDTEKENSDLVDRNLTSRIEDYDANFFPDGDDPAIDPDCFIGYAEDPVTGDVIQTSADVLEAFDDFCDPPPFDFSGLNPNEPDPEPAQIDPSTIQACLDSALDKVNEIQKSTQELGRWQKIEMDLQEILYHIDIIHDFQKDLVDFWRQRIGVPQEGQEKPVDLVFQILLYNDLILNKGQEIQKQKLDLKNSQNIFVQNNPIFNSDLFSISLTDTEFSGTQLLDFFTQSTNGNNSFININQENNTYPINEAISLFTEKIEEIRYILIKNNFINLLEEDLEDLFSVRQSYIESLAQKKGIQPEEIDPENLNPLFAGFNPTFSLYLLAVQRVFEVAPLPIGLQIGQDGRGFEFIKKVKDFSARFTDISVDFTTGLLKFTFAYPADFGFPLPYKLVEKPAKLSITGESTNPIEQVLEPDIEKIRIGNEYGANGGLLIGYPSDYLTPVPNFYDFVNIRTGQDDVTDFYSFIERVINTPDSKQDIINEMVSSHGVLYGQLIEKSASTWLFFNPTERGDNDARDPSKLRPSSYIGDGEPNQQFRDFWGNFKPKWSEKYNQNKQSFVDPAIRDIKEQSKNAAQGLAETLPIFDEVTVSIFDSYFEIKRRKDQIEELLLIAAQKREEKEEETSGESVRTKFQSCNCGGEGEISDQENCPPACCGDAGSDFNFGDFLTSLPPASDCPTIYQTCWWKKFCEHATTVGLLPYPNGIPPIEDPSFFLAQGPSVRFGLKYWPVGYLPPAFIPIPIPNPIDGQPYIRIPLPMIWNVIPPIILPLPLGLGMIVIFIPLIGGFMPTPLVYLKEFITGSSLFLTGIRGPRFIPRRSDPSLPDPLEQIKQALTFGIPDKLIPLPNFGLDDIDSPERILSDLQTNFTKIFDSVPAPGNMNAIRNLQDREIALKAEIDGKIKDYQKQAALLDIPEPDVNAQKEALRGLIQERKNALITTIKDYIETGIPEPKSIVFPKDKDKLKTDIPGIVKSFLDLKDMKASFVPLKCPEYVNIKEEIKEILKLLKIPTPSQYSSENSELSNQSKIFLRVNKDPRSMNGVEFGELVDGIRSTSLVITHILMRGNNFSVLEKIKGGSFSSLSFCDYVGTFSFPPLSITNSAPSPLDLPKVSNPIIEEIYLRLMDGMSSAQYTPQDFARYVRYDGETPQMVIRVKDLKKLISKKLGLSRRGPFELERPLDLEEPLISRFPHPEGPLCCLESLSGGFGNAISAFELTTLFPPKQDQLSQSPGLGGIPQITIPGSVIKGFVKEAVGTVLNGGILEQLMPEINDIDSPKFINLQPQDIQKMARNLVRDTLNPEGAIPPFLELTQVPVLPLARPTDMVEQVSVGLGVPPIARLPQSLLWQYLLGSPKSPLPEEIIQPVVKLASSLLSNVPWPIAVLLGRNVINLINPLRLRDDHPAWRRMSLNNTLYVVYLDEFLRSAADVSGLFKFFFGAADPVYPLPELPDELQKAFSIKKI
jgi:hypothetical protein